MTIGISTSSKIWSNNADRVPALIDWCDRLAEKLRSGTASLTNTGIDHLRAGQEIDQLPTDIIAADWSKGAYSHPLTLQYKGADGAALQAQLLDCELLVDQGATTGGTIGLVLQIGAFKYPMTFSYDSNRPRLLMPADDTPEPVVSGEYVATMPLTNYVNEQYPILYTASFGYVQGGDLFEPPGDDLPPFDPGRLEVEDWSARGVDPHLEAGNATAAGRSIHEWLGESLALGVDDIVFHDHGSGEIADYVTVRDGEQVLVSFYHCKSYKEANPGGRVADLSEVCTQAVKSRNWASAPRIFQRIGQRAASQRSARQFLKGDLATLARIIGPGRVVEVRVQMVVVQPGLSRAAMNMPLGSQLASADEYIFGGRCDRLRVICSA